MGTALRHMLVAACVLVVLAPGSAQSPLPVQRRVEGQTLISDALPRAAITFDPAFRYAGSQRFVLYGVAEAEQHFFVDALPGREIGRFYWVQFEHFLAGNEERYRYTSSLQNEIGGLSFIVDTRIYTAYAALKPDPDSDGARGRGLLVSRGFKLPDAAIRARLIHLPGGDNRSELTIIYVEALAPDRLPPGATNEMSADGRFPGLSEYVIRHARAGLTIGPVR